MNKKLIRLTESDLHNIVKESVNRVLNETDAYSYNGIEYRNNILKKYNDQIERENNYKENLIRFKEAYKLVSSEYSIIKTLKRRPSIMYDAQSAFSIKRFLSYVKKMEGDTLYDKIWEKFGGEYEEVADQYLQQCVIRLQNGTYDDWEF